MISLSRLVDFTINETEDTLRNSKKTHDFYYGPRPRSHEAFKPAVCDFQDGIGYAVYENITDLEPKFDWEGIFD